MIYGHDHFVHVNFELFGNGIDNPQVGLMGNVPIDFVYVYAGNLQAFFHALYQTRNGYFENFFAVHVDKTGFLVQRNAAVRTKMVVLAAVGINFGGKNPGIAAVTGSFRRAENCRAGTVAEQHAGIAVGPVGNFGKRFGTDYKRGFDLPQADHVIGDL